jgi:hypothetical protein
LETTITGYVISWILPYKAPDPIQQSGRPFLKIHFNFRKNLDASSSPNAQNSKPITIAEPARFLTAAQTTHFTCSGQASAAISARR